MQRRGGASLQLYNDEGGIDFLKNALEYAELSNFKKNYEWLKKYALLRRLQKEKYDISAFYIDDKDVKNPLQAVEVYEHLRDSSIETILNSIEGKYAQIRNEYMNGGQKNSDPAVGIMNLIDELKKTPSVGPSLEGEIFSGACRGARSGCFFLKSASTSAGKTRTSVFDACHLCYPRRWSHTDNTFMEEIDKEGKVREPRKVLFIVTEMDKEELQTIMLAYLSGVDEDHIIRGKYELGEESRVRFAAKIMEEYSGYFIIEEIADPNLQNVEVTIKKYATVDEVKYVFFDYLHTTASLINSFARSGLREDVVLMLLANQLKQLAKDYNIFIFSATQVNMNAMEEDGEFKNEMSIRGSKAVADKADMAYVMTRVTEKLWNTLVPTLKAAAASGIIPAEYVDDPEQRPTHILDIYKMRRGRYKNVRIWTHLHLGTGYRHDLFITTAENQVWRDEVKLFHEYDIRLMKKEGS